jgi:hypothetical protein
VVCLALQSPKGHREPFLTQALPGLQRRSHRCLLTSPRIAAELGTTIGDGGGELYPLSSFREDCEAIGWRQK